MLVRDGSSEFRVEIRGDVAVLVQEGSPLFDETTKSLAAVIATASKIGSKKIIVDARLSDLADYYSYVVRHAELIPLTGFDSSFRSAIVGLPEQVHVMDFIVSVGRNRGWTVRRFYDIDEALQWLRQWLIPAPRRLGLGRRTALSLSARQSEVAEQRGPS